MKESVFTEVLNIWREGKKDETWQELAGRYGYVSGEALRDAFKAERKRRGVTKENKVIEVKIASSPIIGILDIETLPILAFVWDLFNVNVSTEQVFKETCLLSWAGKFLNDSKVYSDYLTPTEAIVRNTARIVTSCWDFMKQCDIIVVHNFSSFDGRLMSTFFLKYDLPPLKYITVDTLLVARSNLRFSSNKMGFINHQLGIREKVSNEGFPLWRKCSEGDQEALTKMLNYNIGDVFATEDLFYKLRPYIKNINMALYNEIIEAQCPVCGSLDLTSEGFYYTSAGRWESMRCNNCKSLSRKKQNLLSTEKKKSLLINS